MIEPVRLERLRQASVESGAATLQAIARVREQFPDAWRAVERRPAVLTARSAMDCRDSGDGAWMEFYLEADVAGRTVCWWLDAAWREAGWEISASVAENRDDAEYQNKLRDFPTRHAPTVGALAVELEAAATELLATTELAEFLAPAV